MLRASAILLLCAHSVALAAPAVFVLDEHDATAAGNATAVEDCSRPSSAEAWGAAIGFSVLISVVSMVGVVLIPALTTARSRQLVIPFLVAFGAGSMLTSAVAVLIPEAYGLHAHGGEGEHAGETEEEHEEHESEDGKLYLKRAAVVLAGSAFFFLLQQVFRHSHDTGHHMNDFDDPDAGAVPKGSSGHSHSHSHSHTHGSHNSAGKPKTRAAGVAPSSSSSSASSSSASSSSSSSSDASGSYASDSTTEDVSYTESASRGGVDNDDDATNSTTHEHAHGLGAFIGDVGLKHASAGWVNLASDAVHNFTDGLIIGSIFTTSIARGIAVSIPVLVHELAQEFGDFAFLLHSGFSRWKALAFNGLSGIIALIGALVGLAIGESAEEANPWIAAFAAGGFLFVSLTLMLPEMLHIRGGHLSLLNQSVAFVMGCLVTFLIVFYVDEDLIGGSSC
jgi:zinc transporter 10